MTIRNSSNIITFGVPLLIVGLMILIATSKLFEANPETLSIGITLDLLFTVPVIYFLLIRKKKIPKITIVPFFIVGMLIASNIIPQENQFILNWAKTWIFPIIELGVATFIFFKVRQTLKKYRSKAVTNPDFFSALKDTCREIIPPKIAELLVMELAVFYYGFIDWKKKKLGPNEFSYHKNSGTISLLIAFIPIIGIETYVIHVLLLKWSAIAAWIASILSVYTCIQVFGFMKSILKRPITIEGNKLYLRYGILSETIIDIHNIESINISGADLEWNDEIKKLSPLGDLESHNMVITLKQKNTLTGLYGIKKNYTTIAFFIDHKEDFKAKLENILCKV